MSYILMIWTVVSCGDIRVGCKMDWRPIGEFHSSHTLTSVTDALQRCQEAARQLSINAENFRCVRSK